MTTLNKLHDHYGQELNLGDMVLGAVGGGRFRQTRFVHAVVVGRTKQMVRLHQISSNGDKQFALQTLKERGTKRGDRVLPTELIRLHEGFLTVAEIEANHDVSLDPNGVVLPKAVQILRPSNQQPASNTTFALLP
jgi:hypothetical protein